jgi:peptidoglycan/LPS O-acetylase OafA/YrhL
LSGYVLTYTFFKSRNQVVLVSGAVRRYIRLLIPVLFLILIVYLFIAPGPEGLMNANAIKTMLSQAFLGVFVQGQYVPFIANSTEYTAVLWTMTIEFIGSFIVFSFASLFGKLRNRWVFYIVAVLVFLNTYYLAFILGMALADLSFCDAFKKYKKLKNPGFAATVFLIGLLLGSYPVIPFFEPVYSFIDWVVQSVFSALSFISLSPFQTGSTSALVFIYITGAFFILAALLNSGWLQGVFSSRILVFLGKISFSLYLIHMVVILTFSYFILGILFGNTLNLFTGICIFFITTLVLLGCSFLMYKYVDLSGITFSKRAYNQFFAENRIK